MKKQMVSLIFAMAALAVQAATPPNIILMLADDAGYNDFGFQNNQEAYRKATPNVDALAAEGMRFDQAYVSANVCAPSRAGMITGRYQERDGFRDNLPAHFGKPQPVWYTDEAGEIGLAEGVKTAGDHLQSLGYYTGIVGKWHLGYAEKFAPHNRGFDFFKGLRAGSRSFFPIKKFETELLPQRYHQLEKNGEFLPESEIKHVTQSQGDAALEFIDEAQAEKKPFFLFLSFTAPHSPLQPDAASLKVAKKLFPEADIKRQRYMGLVIGMDRQIGQVREHLKAKGIDKETLIVFLSDNGGAKKNSSNNDPLRGHKWTPFEGGYRVPMVFKWPGRIAPGSVHSEPVISLDLLPTFIGAAGGKAPADLDGVPLQPIFAGEKIPARSFCWWDCNSEGLTSTILNYPWKLIQRESALRGTRKFKANGAKPWLFNLEQDPAETNNMADQHPEKLKQLEAEFGTWIEQMPEPRW